MSSRSGSTVLEPCPGCGALFPNAPGPTHRYIGASAGCWALFGMLSTGHEPGPDELQRSRVTSAAAPQEAMSVQPQTGVLMGDAYAVQHHGGQSPQAVQSVALHLLVLHSALARGVNPSERKWVLGRALRRRGVFRKLQRLARGQALTIRHLFPGDGVADPRSRDDYVASVYAAWAGLHLDTIETWYDSYVVPDRLNVES